MRRTGVGSRPSKSVASESPMAVPLGPPFCEVKAKKA